MKPDTYDIYYTTELGGKQDLYADDVAFGDLHLRIKELFGIESAATVRIELH